MEQEQQEENGLNYGKRAPWLRAAVLGANDGLVSTASLMMGVGAVKQDMKAMILTGFAGMVAGACSMAIGEFVSVHSQHDMEVAQLKRSGGTPHPPQPPANPAQAAAASVVAFVVGGTVPVLAAAFVKGYKVRVAVMVAAVTAALAAFGWLGAALGGAPRVKASARVLVGGWMAMVITSGLTKLIDLKGE